MRLPRAPDERFKGFGKSDKPAEMSDHSYQKHVGWMTGLITLLDLRDITLVCQDWGGLIGLRIAAEHEERFKRTCVSSKARNGLGSLWSLSARIKLTNCVNEQGIYP